MILIRKDFFKKYYIIMMSSLNFHRVKKRVETLGDIPKSPNGGV